MNKISLDERKLRYTLMFLIKLIVLSLPLYVFLELNIGLDPLQSFIAQHVFYFLKMTGMNPNMNGFSISLDKTSIIINKDCTGWKGILFFSALVLSTSSSWKKRIWGILIGIPSIFSVNILRIIVMIWIGINSPEFFQLIHDILWQSSMILLVLILWIIWWRNNIF
ncbi:MAG: archaeosortase/exosortase family protein [Candidatus Aenigmarchaeota archaeon]|nr:archaeosortase/exosortase family protein [Candidatus Aenigmarchaeota archaeon]